jgi:hypothetical protein
MRAAYARGGDATGCSTMAAASHFSARGIRPDMHSGIWREWLARWCSRDDLGPATSPERFVKSHHYVQDFRQTGHRIVWPPLKSLAQVLTMWSWVQSAFTAHGVARLQGTPLTGAWTSAYLHDRIWGAALDPPYALSACADRSQRFTWGDATLTSRTVSYTSARMPRTHFRSHEWRPILRLARSWVTALTRRDVESVRAHSSPPLRVSGALWRSLGIDAWPVRGAAAISWWNEHTATVRVQLVVTGRRVDDTLELSSRPAWQVNAVTRGWAEPTCAPPPTPTPVAISGTYAVGDSVMEDAAPALTGYGITVNAVVGMQFVTGAALLEGMAAAHTLPPRVVIGLGTNGPMTVDQLNTLLSALQGEQRVVLVTVREPRFWQDTVNAEIRAAATRWPNVQIADWYAASNAHPEWFASDGIHTGSQGGAVYAGLVVAALQSR